MPEFPLNQYLATKEYANKQQEEQQGQESDAWKQFFGNVIAPYTQMKAQEAIFQHEKRKARMEQDIKDKSEQLKLSKQERGKYLEYFTKGQSIYGQKDESGKIGALTPQSARGLAGYFSGQTEQIPQGVVPSPTWTGLSGKTSGGQTVSITPKDEQEASDFTNQFPGISFTAGTPTNLSKVAYDQWLQAKNIKPLNEAKLELAKLRVAIAKQQSSGTLTPEKIQAQKTRLYNVLSNYPDDSVKELVNSDIDYLESLQVKLGKQEKSKGTPQKRFTIEKVEPSK